MRRGHAKLSGDLAVVQPLLSPAALGLNEGDRIMQAQIHAPDLNRGYEVTIKSVKKIKPHKEYFTKELWDTIEQRIQQKIKK